MSNELENMRRLATVRIDRMSTLPIKVTAPIKVIEEVHYTVLSDDGAPMFSGKLHRDVSDIPGIATKTMAERYDWAVARAKEDAKTNWGKP